LPFGLQGVVQNLLPAAFAQGWFGTWLLAPHWYFFVAKVFTLLFVFIWVRGSWPRYRYDQVMDVAWKYLIPLTIVNLVVAGFVRYHA
jgi:NADH-quinone oxidoreductase subunit H